MLRITSNLYPTLFKQQVQSLQNQQIKYQTQISTRLAISKSSDNPIQFQQAQQLSAEQAANNAFLSNTEDAITLMNSNYNSMSDLQTLLSRASEIAMSSSAQSPSELEILGIEMDSILEQVVSVANTQYNGRYLFGSTGNVPPVVVDSAGPPVTYEFNTSALYNGNVTELEIAEGNTFETGITAGSSTAPFDGFLYSDGVDVLALVQDIRDQLQGNPPYGAPQAVDSADITDIISAVDIGSEYVGKTAAKLSALELNKSRLDNLILSTTERIDSKTSANLANAITDLSLTQTTYDAALQSGLKILSMSIFDYM